MKKLVIGIIILTAGLALYFTFSGRSKNAENQLENTSKAESESAAQSLDKKIIEWETFLSKKYNFGFSFPANMLYKLNGGDSYDWGDYNLEIAPRIHILVGDDFKIPPVFNLEVQDPESFNIPKEVLQMSVRDWAEESEQINLNDKNSSVPNKKVGGLEKVTVADKAGYKFTVTYTFKPSEGSGFVLFGVKEEPAEHIFVFLENEKRSKFLIWFPTNNELSTQILQSFKFTD